MTGLSECQYIHWAIEVIFYLFIEFAKRQFDSPEVAS